MYTAVVDAPTGRVTLGANQANGIEQKGIDTLQQCIKKCASAGLGIPATVCTVNRRLAETAVFFYSISGYLFKSITVTTFLIKTCFDV